MKNKILTFIIIAIVAITSCKKENNQPNNGNGTNGTGTIVTTGTLYFKNTKSDPYKIYIDNTYKFTVSAGQTSTSYSVTGGVTYTIKAEQATGYVIYPTIYNGTAYANSGSSFTWTF